MVCKSKNGTPLLHIINITMIRPVPSEKTKLQFIAAYVLRLNKWAGPFSSIMLTLLIGLATLSISRIGLVAWQWDRVQATGIPVTVLIDRKSVV